MKTNPFITTIILLFMSYACNQEDMPQSVCYNLHSTIQTRGVNSGQVLPTNSRIILYANGGTEVNHEIFKYNGTTWDSENNVSFNQSDDSTYVTALYPVYESLYTDEGLTDILIAQDTICGNSSIHLSFKHLFSSLVIHVEESILNSLEEIQITTPMKASGILPSGKLETTENAYTTTIRQNGTSDYTFIIPPSENCILRLSLEMKDGSTYQQTLQAYTFKSGVKYECNLMTTDSAPAGIYTVDDLIAFCKLINRESYDGTKTLASFSDSIDGKRIFYLRKDLALTKDDCNQLSPIGYKTDKYFTDTFDGLGHKISNLTIKASNTNAGLFGRIESGGVIRNLHLENSHSTLTNSSSHAGILAGVCYGTIDHCSINHCSLTNNYSSYTGGMIGQMRAGSSIINSSVSNTTLTTTEDLQIGGFVGYLAEGEIINCYAYNNTISGESYRGGICGHSENGKITNCYVFKLSISSNDTQRGIFIGRATKTTLSYCHYLSSSSLSLIKKETNCTITPNYKFTGTDFKETESKKPVHDLLNEWIGQQEIYNHWLPNDTLPAVFQ